MAKDIVLRAGIKFDPKEVDVRAIRQAIVTSLSKANISIAKSSFAKTALDSLKTAFSKVLFRISKSQFDSQGRSTLQASFAKIPFVIQRARFGRNAINELKQSFGKIKFSVGAAGVASTRAAKTAAGVPTTTGGTTQQAVQLNTGRQAVEIFRSQAAGLEAVVASTSAAERATASYNRLLVSGATNAEGYGAKIGQITTRFTAYLVSLKALFAVQQAFHESLRFIVEFDSVLQDLQKVLNTTPEGLRNVAIGLFNVAETTGKSVTDVASSFGIFKRAGLETEDALKRAEASLVAANISELNVEEATKLVTSAMIIFGKEVGNEINALDILSVTADNAATSAAEVGRAFLRSASAAEAVGISYNELNAISATTIEATQRTGSTVGTALRTIFSRLVSNSDALKKQANAFGANIQPGERVFDVLQKLAKIFPSLNNDQKAQLTLLVAGRRRFSEFNALLTNFGRINELLSKQLGSAGTAARKNREELEKLSTQGQRLRNVLSDVLSELVGLKEGADATGTLRNVFSGVITNLTDGVNVLLKINSSIKDITHDSLGLGTIFSALVTTGFLIKGLPILKGIIGGFKTFISLAFAANKAVQRIVFTEKQLPATFDATIAKQKQSLEIDEHRLIIARKIAKERSLQFAGNIPRGARSQLKEIGRGAKETLTGQGTQIVAFTALVAVVDGLAKALKKRADQFREQGKEAEAASGELSALKRESAAVGLQMGTMVAIFNPLLGALTAVTVSFGSFALQTIKLVDSFKTAERILANRGKVRTGREAAAQFGELGREAFNELGLKVGTVGAFADQVTLATQAGRKATDANNAYAKASSDATDLILKTRKELEALNSAISIRRDIEEATARIREKAFTISARIDTGTLSKELAPIQQSTAKLVSNMQKINSSVRDSATAMALFQASSAAIEERQKNLLDTDEDIVRKHGLRSKILNDLITKQRDITTAINNQKDVLDSTFQKHQKVREGLEKTEAILRKQLEKAELNNQATQDQEAILKELTTVTGQIAAINKQRLDQQEKLQTLSGQQRDIDKQVAQESSRILNIAKDSVIANKEIVAQIEQAPISIKASNVQIKEEIELLKESLAVRQNIAQQSLQATTLAEKSAVKELTARGQAEEQIKKINATRLRGAQFLQKQEEAAAKAVALATTAVQKKAAQEQLDIIKKRRADFQKAVGEEEKLLKRKIDFQLKIELVEDLQNQIKQAERAILDVRLRGIDEAAQREERFAQQRISLIQKLGESSAGRKFLEREFKPSDTLKREFGFVGSIIVDELDNATSRAVAKMVERINVLKDSGADAFQLLQEAQSSASTALERIESDTAEKRQIVLEALEKKSKAVTSAEEELVNARNKIPPLNARISASEKNVASSNKGVEDANNQLIKANQELADSQLRLSFEIGLAEFKVRQSTGSFKSVGEQISSLSSIFNSVTNEIRGSSQAILEIRRQVLQEELSLVQSQFESIKGLALEAATGGVDTVNKLRSQISAAQQIAKSTSVKGIPPELLQGIERFSNIVPGLEQALLEIGASALGIDPSIFKSLEDQMVELAKGIAETGKIQVDQAGEQVQAAREQLAKAEEQKKIAEQELQTSISIKDAAVRNANIAASNAAAFRVGFGRATDVAIKQLQRLEEGSSTNKEALGFLGQLQQIQTDQLAEIQGQKASAERRLKELQGVSKGIAQVISELKTMGTTITSAVSSLSSQISSSLKSVIGAAFGGGTVPHVAQGSLSKSEFSSLRNAALQEKKLMPPGSKLMLANTSEVVLTRRQAKQIGFMPRQQPFAQAGNATGNFEGAINSLVAATNALTSKLSDPGLVNQDISVQLDSSREINVKGLDAIDGAVRSVFEQKIGGLATKEEQKAIAEVVMSIINKLNEQGIVNAQGF